VSQTYGPPRPVTGIALSFYHKKARIKRYEKIGINNEKAGRKNWHVVELTSNPLCVGFTIYTSVNFDMVSRLQVIYPG
jgi:hypothetical protein